MCSARHPGAEGDARLFARWSGSKACRPVHGGCRSAPAACGEPGGRGFTSSPLFGLLPHSELHQQTPSGIGESGAAVEHGVVVGDGHVALLKRHWEGA